MAGGALRRCQISHPLAIIAYGQAVRSFFWSVTMCINENRCPCCKSTIGMPTKTKLLIHETITCQTCGTSLTVSIFSAVLATCILGVPAWLLFDELLITTDIHNYLKLFLGFSVCMFTARLGFPFTLLAQVER